MPFLCRNGHFVKHAWQAGLDCSKCKRNERLRTMKTFIKMKSLVVIKAQCEAAGVAFDDYNFRLLHRDYVCLGIAAADKRPDGTPLVRPEGFAGKAYVMFNTFNGTFYGHTDKGVPFGSNSAGHEAEPWFQALLNFFYVAKD